MENPLVSIFIITYNSSAYIKETLDSTLTQTYSNLELIISDDCSTDNTVEICENWLQENKDKFKRTKLVVADKNKGVAPNCNQAIRESQGEWLKGLSGDDKLLPNSIQDYVDYVSHNTGCDIVFGKLRFTGEDLNLVSYVQKIYEKNFYPKIKSSQRSQYIENLKNIFIPGPGLFFTRKLYDKVGGFDENYPMCEEDPFYTKLLQMGYHVKFIDKELYCYQVRNNSLGRETKFNLHLKDRAKFFKDYRKNLLIKAGYPILASYLNLLFKYHEFYGPISSLEKTWTKFLYFINPYSYIYKLKTLILSKF